MIVVTGIPRSGTSMVMQTLRILGVSIVGEKFPKHEIPETNPKGFWEMDLAQMLEGVKDNRYKGKAVKLLGPGLSNTPRSLISKAIVIERDPLECRRSLWKCFQASGLPLEQGDVHHGYSIFKKAVEEFLSENTIPILKLRFDEMTKNPEREVYKIARFLGVNPNPQAVDNVG